MRNTPEPRTGLPADSVAPLAEQAEQAEQAERVPVASGNPVLAAVARAVLVLLSLGAVASGIMIVTAASTDDDPRVLVGVVIFMVAVTAAIVLGLFYTPWFIEPKVTRAIDHRHPDTLVWPGLSTPALRALVSATRTAPLARKVYFVVSPNALTVWQREDHEVVAVLEIPRAVITSVATELVHFTLGLHPGVVVNFGPTQAPTVVQLVPRRIRDNSDSEARTLAAALAPTSEGHDDLARRHPST